MMYIIYIINGYNEIYYRYYLKNLNLINFENNIYIKEDISKIICIK